MDSYDDRTWLSRTETTKVYLAFKDQEIVVRTDLLSVEMQGEILATVTLMIVDDLGSKVCALHCPLDMNMLFAGMSDTFIGNGC